MQAAEHEQLSLQTPENASGFETGVFRFKGEWPREMSEGFKTKSEIEDMDGNEGKAWQGLLDERSYHVLKVATAKKGHRFILREVCFTAGKSVQAC